MLKQLRKPDAILFDWDGTLVDSLPALLSYYNHVLTAFKMPLYTEEDAKKKIRKSARDIFPDIFGDRADEAFKLYFECVEKSHLDHLHPYDLSALFLNRLAELKIPAGIVSNKRHKFLLKEITHLGWDQYLTSNVGAGEAAKDKPAADPLLMAAEKLGLSPIDSEIWFVGDTETDMQAAIAAGFQPIFIEHGMGTRQECHDLGLLHHSVKDLSELIALVEKYYP